MLRILSLKQKMILGGIAAVFFPFLAVGAIVYVQLSDSLLAMGESISVHYAEVTAKSIDEKLMQEMKVAAAIAADPDIIDALRTRDFQEAQTEIDEIYEHIGEDFFTIFLLDNRGVAKAEATFTEQIGLDLSDRDYFLQAQKGKTGVDGPLFPRGNAALNEAIVIVYVPVEENNEFLGVVGIPINIQFLVDIISENKSGRTGFAYAVNSEGLVLFHPTKNLSLTFHLDELPGTEEIMELIAEKKTGAAYTFLTDTKQLAGLATSALTGWKIIYSQDKGEIMMPLNRLLWIILLSAIGFLSITILIIGLFSSRISTPVQKLMEIMKHVTEHSSEIIMQIGTNRKIKFVNPAFEKITGLASKDIIGTELPLNNDKGITKDKIWELLEDGNIWSGRIRLKGQDTKAIVMDVMLIPFTNNKEIIEGNLLIGRDVTNELMYEERLQQSQKLEAIGTLAGGIAHDFNNIISGISGYAELTLMMEKNSAETDKYMREIVKASERARDLVSQILTFSRQAEVELKPLLPKSIIKEALRLLDATIQSKISIESSLNSDAAIVADPTQIHQIVMNLFMNAVHAIGGNPGTIKIELEDFIVDDEFVKMHPNIKTGKHVLLRVSDTGKGIEQEHLKKIFEPFFTTKSRGKGTGLGLSMVHGIVKKLDGIITAYSEVGKGTVFSIILPATDADDKALLEKEAELKKGTEKVAIIDDETPIVASLHSILTNLGYMVKAFTNSSEALELIKERPNEFDIIITDYSMPQITGLELAKDIRTAGLDIPIILTSGFLGQGMEEIAKEAGISAFIGKPISTYKLADMIRNVLDNPQKV